VEFLESYISDHPEEVAPHQILATYYTVDGNLTKAISAYERALELQPQKISNYLAISRLHQDAGDVQAAIDTLDRALSLAPGNTALLSMKASLLEASGEYQDAADIYTSILETNPGYIVAANNLAMLLIDRLASEANVARALAITEGFDTAKEPVLLDTRGWVYYTAGDYENARSLLEKSISDPKKVIPIYQYHLGMTYIKLAEAEKARIQLQAALDAGIEFPRRDNAMKSLEAL
jgi:tetratricopeptide (TPR) repeat protein